VYARSTTILAQASLIDAGIRYVRHAVLPVLTVSSVTYDDLAAIERTRAQAATIRTADTQHAGAEVLDVGEFELAIAHLRVPELA
jgi:hypothetical protein